jgi:hypothetical protein
LAFGVTAEVHTSSDRSLTQEWAAAFAAAGFDGVRSFVRHDPGQRRIGIAIFGRVGIGIIRSREFGLMVVQEFRN